MLGETARVDRADSQIDVPLDDRPTTHVPSRHRSSRHVLPVVALLAFVSALSAWIHAAAVRPHLEEYRLFGEFFIVVTMLQVAWTVAILVKPGRRLFAIGAIGNAALALLWLVSRTKGIPIGPEPWTPEAVGWADVLSTICEVVATVGCVWLLRRDRAPGVARSSDELPSELTIREAAFVTGAAPQDIERLIAEGRLSAREVIPGMSDRGSTLVRSKDLRAVGLLTGEGTPAVPPAPVAVDSAEAFAFGGRTDAGRSSSSGGVAGRALAAAAIVCIAGTALTAVGIAPSLPHEHDGGQMAGAIVAPAASMGGRSMRVVIGGVERSVTFGPGRYTPLA